jgi:hypothetical protein
MLGELVAREIKQIEHEKACKCANCEVNGTIRMSATFLASHECDCPVCQVAKTQISSMIKKLVKLGEDLGREHIRIGPLVAQGRHSTEDEQEIRNVAGLEGGIMYASRVLRNMILNYGTMIEAAHEAYEVVHASGAIGGVLKTLHRVAQAAPTAARPSETDELPN